MDTISLPDAFSLWLSGQNVSDKLLWGVEILWWGRFGKIISFFAGLTLIVEIIGLEKLKAFGDSLHQLFDQLRKSLLNGFEWGKLKVKAYWYHLAEDDPKMIQALNELRAANLENLFGLPNLAIAFMLTAISVARELANNAPWWVLVLSGIFAFLYSLLLIGPILIVMMIFLAYILYLLFIKPLAWLLTRPYLNTFIKIASLSLLLIGFFFDLLAS